VGWGGDERLYTVCAAEKKNKRNRNNNSNKKKSPIFHRKKKMVCAQIDNAMACGTEEKKDNLWVLK
jgi:hypothetical protein